MVYNTRFTPEQNNMFRKYAWRTLLGVSLLLLFIYNGRLNMGASLPMMIKELGWSKNDAGNIVSVLFWVMAFGQLFNGRLCEIFNVKKFIFLGAILSVVANWTISFATSTAIITVLWGINGYFQSMITSPSFSMISKWWPKRKRGFATGIIDAFSALGHVMVQVSVAASLWLVPSWGWRSAFRIPVALLLLVVVIYFYLVKASPSEVGLFDYEDDGEAMEYEKKLNKQEQQSGTFYPYKWLLKQWQFIAVCLISFMYGCCRFGLLTWIPLYYIEQLGLSIERGILDSLVLPAGMAVGSFILPFLADKFFIHNRFPVIAFCGIACTATLFFLSGLNTINAIAIALFWAGFFIHGIDGLLYVMSVDIGCRVYAGTASGIMSWACYMGAAAQAILFGWLLDTTASWSIIFLTTACLCIAIAVIALVAHIKNCSMQNI